MAEPIPNNVSQDPSPAVPPNNISQKDKSWRAKTACTYLSGTSQRFVRVGEIVQADKKPNEHFEAVS
jgi:hypothetical protein